MGDILASANLGASRYVDQWLHSRWQFDNIRKYYMNIIFQLFEEVICQARNFPTFTY